MKNILTILFATLFFVGCNDSYLEKYPQAQTEETMFATYDNFKSYVWSFYEVFTNTNLGASMIDGSHYRNRGDEMAGYFSEKGQTAYNKYGFNLVKKPLTDKAWNFSNIRKVNIMLKNIPNSKLQSNDKLHWEGVARFFRAYLYVELLSRYGDVPWIDRPAIDEFDQDVVYAARDNRCVVADHIYEDLIFAIANVKDNGDGPNTINKDCARTLFTRFALFEATWRRYHKTSEEQAIYRIDDLLMKNKEVCETLVAKHKGILPNFNERYLKLSLEGAPGVFLYKEYITGVIANNITRFERNEANKYELHKSIVDMYLCSDGKPISTSMVYQGDKSIYHECRNRDPRLLMSIVPPYFDKNSSKAINYTPPVEFNIDPLEYVDKLKEVLPNPNWFRIPLPNWNNNVIIYTSPNIGDIAHSSSTSRSGYTFTRHFSKEDNLLFSKGQLDKPIFYMEEVYLNYAETMAELGLFNQQVADKSINILRKRAGMPDMIITQVNESFDKNRNPEVSPLIWEIRRERLVELLGEGFGFNDIRRWKQAPWFIDRPFMGCYIRHADYSNKSDGAVNANYSKLLLTKTGNDIIGSKNSEGYLYRFSNPKLENKGWKDAYYLYPIPTSQILLNNKLTQNPGWEEL